MLNGKLIWFLQKLFQLFSFRVFFSYSWEKQEMLGHELFKNSNYYRKRWGLQILVSKISLASNLEKSNGSWHSNMHQWLGCHLCFWWQVWFLLEQFMKQFGSVVIGRIINNIFSKNHPVLHSRAPKHKVAHRRNRSIAHLFLQFEMCALVTFYLELSFKNHI